MKEFFHSVKFKILVCIFALLLGFMLYAAVSSGGLSAPEAILDAVTRPFVQLSAGISSWMQNTIDKFVNADVYQKENEILRQQLTEMYKQINDKEKIEEENQQLREILKIAAENDTQKLSPPCEIIARNANDIFSGFTINRGTNDGIKLYDPVFTSIGLVGIVTQTGNNSSSVTTIYSTDIEIGVVTAESEEIGVIENSIKYAADGYCLIRYLPGDSDIKTGEAVFTSGSSIFPPGMMIGVVEKVFKDDNEMSLNALVKPAENISKITNVFVITYFEGQGETVQSQ